MKSTITPEQMEAASRMVGPMRELVLAAIAEMMHHGATRKEAQEYAGALILGTSCGFLISAAGRIRPSDEWNMQIIEFINQMIATLPRQTSAATKN